MGLRALLSNFEAGIRELLRRVHGNHRHVGRSYHVPMSETLERAAVLGELRDRLRRAIESEQFESRRIFATASGDGVTMDLSLLPDGGVGWLDASGAHSDIVLSTRIRLARNVEGYAFTGRARDGERLRVLSQVREAVTSVSALQQSVMYRLDELPPTARALLHERHLVSKELAGLDMQHPSGPGRESPGRRAGA